MSLKTYIQSHINSLKFLGLFKQKNNQKALVELALKERGILFKIMQNVSPELLDNSTSGNKAIPQKEIIKLIENNLHLKFNEHFIFLGPAIFCASIGQVHKAILKDNTAVAIKIQYPNAISSIQSQLNLLRAASLGAKISKISKWKINIDAHIINIEEKLREELDYQHELKNLIEFSQKNPNCKLKPYGKYSSSLVLTQTWIEGLNLVDIKNNWPYEKRKLLAELVVTQFLKHLFIDGFFQGDNNLSNFIITEDPIDVVWIDFGNWVHINDQVRQSLNVLLYKTIKKENVNFLGHFENIGFDLEKIQYFQNLLPSLLEILFDPFLLNHPFDLKHWKLEERIGKLLGENKWWFRSSGNPSFLELMKSFFGLVKTIEYLDVNINWQSIFINRLPGFDRDTIDALTPQYKNTIPQTQDLAKQLVIQVLKEGKEHVKIELPAGTFFELENFMPEDIQAKLQARKINLAEIKSRYLEKGLIPGKVFELQDHSTVFLVYLT